MKLIKFICRGRDRMLTILVALFGLAASNFLLFHIAAEGITIIISIIFFVEAHKKRKGQCNCLTVFIGYALLFTCIIDFFYVLTYPGMGVPIADSANKSTQLWLAGRYILSCSMLLVPFILKRCYAEIYLRYTFGLTTALILSTIFFYNVIPVCLAENGLTPFKIHNELIIMAIFVMAAWFIYRKREILGGNFFIGIQSALAIFITSEICFSIYDNPFSVVNELGHILEVIAYVFLYYILHEPNVKRPRGHPHNDADI